MKTWTCNTCNFQFEPYSSGSVISHMNRTQHTEFKVKVEGEAGAEYLVKIKTGERTA